MKKKKNIIITVVFVALIVIISVVLVKINSCKFQNNGTNDANNGSEAVESEEESQKIDENTPDKSGIEEFALFGVDSRSDQLDKGTRSDSIMIVKVDHDAKKIRMVSIRK